MNLEKIIQYFLLNFTLMSRHFLKNYSDVSHELQIFYKGYYINRIIYKLVLITSCLLLLYNSTNPLAMNLLNCLWLLISFVRNGRDKCSCKVRRARNEVSTDPEYALFHLLVVIRDIFQTVIN